MTEIDTQYFLKNSPTIIPTLGGRSKDPVAHIQRMIELKDRGWWNPGEMKTHELNFSDVQKPKGLFFCFEVFQRFRRILHSHFFIDF